MRLLRRARPDVESPELGGSRSTTGRRSRRPGGGSGSSPGRARRERVGWTAVSPETCHADGWSFGTSDWSGSGSLSSPLWMMKLTGTPASMPRRVERHPPERAEVVDAVVRAWRRPGGARTGRDALAPQVHSPAVVDAVGAPVVDRDDLLGGGLRRVDRRITGLEPDLRCLRRVEPARIGVGVGRRAVAHDEVDGVRAGIELDPGEAPVVVLTDERRLGGAVAGEIAAGVERPAVVRAVAALVVDDGVLGVDRRAGTGWLGDLAHLDGHAGGVEVAVGVADDRPVLDAARRRRARRRRGRRRTARCRRRRSPRTRPVRQRRRR